MSEIKGVKVAGKVYSLNDEIVRAALEGLREQLGNGSFIVGLASAVKTGAITLEMLDENLKLSASVVDDLKTDDALKPLSANQGKVLKELIDIINGTGEGSTDKKITDAIANLVDKAPENLDTLKELAYWIENHGTEVAEMLAAINANANNLAETKKDIANQLIVTPAANSVGVTGCNEQSMRINFSADIPAATTEKAGVMIAEDKKALDILRTDLDTLSAENSFTYIAETKDTIIDIHTFFRNVKIEYTEGYNATIDWSSIALSLLRKGYTEGKAEIRWSAVINGKREYLFGLSALIDLSDINNDGYTHIEQENTIYGAKITYDVDLQNPKFPINANAFALETEPTMVVSSNCIFKTVESYFRKSYNDDFVNGYYSKITASILNSSGKAPIDLTAASGVSCVEIDVVEGETYYIKAAGTAAVVAWAVIDSERNVLQHSGFVLSFVGELLIPKGASHLIVNNISNGLPALVKVISPIDDFSALYKRAAENSIDASQAKNIAEEANGKAVEARVAVDELKKTFVKSYDELFVENSGYYIKLNEAAVTNNNIPFTPFEYGGAGYAIIDVAEGEKYRLTCKGSVYVASWVIIDQYNRVLEHSGFSADAVVAFEKVMPKGATRLIVNNLPNANTPSVVLAFKINDDIKHLYEKCSELSRWTDTFNVLNGKKILCLGDSITELKGYYDGGLRYSDYIAKKTGAIVYNGGFGGAHMEQRTELTLNPTNEHNARAALDLPAIATALTTGEWNYQDAAVSFLASIGDDNSVIIEELKSVNLQDIDVVTIFIGTNDKDATIGEIGDTTAVANSLGGFYTAISKLLAANPNISIYYFSPIVRYFGKLNEAWDEALWCDNYTGAKGIAFPDIVDKFIEGARYWKIPVCDMYNTMGVNQFNIKAIMDKTNGDGTHPTRGFKMIANKMISFIMANNNLNV